EGTVCLGGAVVRGQSRANRRQQPIGEPGDGDLGAVRLRDHAGGDRWTVPRGEGADRGLRGDQCVRSGRGFGDGEGMAGTRHGGDSPGNGDVVAGRTESTLTAIFREESARLTASLVRVLGDFAVAEEVLQDALVTAWERWPVDGIPPNPAAWLWTVA